MGRRSGLKKAHFSSVPTRMNLFTCKKYVFLIEKNFPNLTTYPKIGKTQHNAIWNLSKDRHFRKRFIEFKKRDSKFFERPLESVD
ncbi:hypothetical protein LIMHP_12810 [Leptospira interrogans serovar Manilae]|nr:hypothetical protein LIMLP_12810 [Leptospira interrogans serovar Manilae]AKP30507.1 hypothetical protein LIMHP_12810 [Leptospira interrogans serovar Manilae]